MSSDMAGVDRTFSNYVGTNLANAGAIAAQAQAQAQQGRSTNVWDGVVSALGAASDIFGKKNPNDVETIETFPVAESQGMSAGAWIGIIGGGALAIGLIIYLATRK